MNKLAFLASLVAALVVTVSVAPSGHAQTKAVDENPPVEMKAQHWSQAHDKTWNTMTCPVRIPLRIVAAPVFFPFYAIMGAANSRSDTPMIDMLLAREWHYHDGTWERERYVLIPWPYQRKAGE